MIPLHLGGFGSFVFGMSLLFFVFVVGSMFYAVFKYRTQSGKNSNSVAHSRPAEIVWTAVPALLLLSICAWCWVVYLKATTPPANAIIVHARGKSSHWTFEYDGGKTSTDELVVPIDRPIEVLLESEDAPYGFFVPALRMRADVKPGHPRSIWFEAALPGKQPVFCIGDCGSDRSKISAQVIALSPLEFETWKAK